MAVRAARLVHFNLFQFAVLTFLNTALGANVVHGGWPIAIVGTEFLVILGTLIAPAVGDLGRTMFVLIHMLWGVGLGLYGIFIVLFAHRIFFFDVGPDDVTPLPGVVMGAAAISNQRRIDAHPDRKWQCRFWIPCDHSSTA